MASLPQIPAHSNRDGRCTACGALVALHFGSRNEKLTCAQVAAKLAAAGDVPSRSLQQRIVAQTEAKREPLDISGWALVGTAPSDSGAGEYELRQDPADGTLGCTCKGWQYRSTCKHVERYIVAQREAQA